MSLYSYLILAAAIVVWMLFLAGLWSAIRNSERRKRARYQSVRSRALRGLYDLNQKISIFQEYDLTYLQSLTASGMPELRDIQGALEQAINLAERCFEEGRITDASVIVEWIVDQRSRPPALDQISPTIQETLDNWGYRSRHIIIRSTEAISEVAEQNQSVGVTRSRRSRRPTLMNMKELRRLITH